MYSYAPTAGMQTATTALIGQMMVEGLIVHPHPHRNVHELRITEHITSARRHAAASS
jgi:hypothetical protein